MAARTPEELAVLFAGKAVGKRIASFEVYAINSIKTFDPALDSLAGAKLEGFASTSEATFRLEVGACTIDVDLQRVGRVAYVERSVAWEPGRPSMPVAQLIFTDGSGIDFVEPGRTKRISFRLSRRNPQSVGSGKVTGKGKPRR